MRSGGISQFKKRKFKFGIEKNLFRKIRIDTKIELYSQICEMKFYVLNSSSKSSSFCAFYRIFNCQILIYLHREAKSHESLVKEDHVQCFAVTLR